MTSSAAQKDNKQWQQRVREWNRADDLLVCCQVHKLSPPLVVVMILLLHFSLLGLPSTLNCDLTRGGSNL